MATQKIRITRAIFLEAGEVAGIGDVVELSTHQAAHLVGAGVAIPHVEEGEDAPAAATTVRMHTPQNADPKPSRVAPKPKAKVV
jgi:predicted metal-dependent RNase